MAKPTTSNRYAAIIEGIFLSKYKPGREEVEFKREDLVATAHSLVLRPGVKGM